MRRCVKNISSSMAIKNFNSESCINADTEILIVGTITPPAGVENGYFYSAPRNKIYGYIDDARRLGKKEKLKELKSKLPLDICKIKRILQEEKVAFLDVMKEVLRPNSYLDEDIIEFTLDIDKFREVFSSYNIKKVICNSRLAESCYNRIKEELKDKGINFPSSTYCAQRGRGKNATKAHWIEQLNER